MPESPLVSILIPTKNSAEHLEQCIASVRAQGYPKIEVIVIDNNSTDATAEIARSKADLVLTAGGERSKQLNTGAQHARGKYLYRIDGDFVLDPNVVAEAVRLCEAHGYDAVAVHNESDPRVSFWARVRNFERSMYKYDPTIVGARFFSKRAFDEVGGFDEDLIAGEDYDIHNRLLARGLKIGRIAPSETHLGEPASLRQFAAKSFFYGQTIGKFMRKSGVRGLRQVSPVRTAFFRHWRKFVAHPALGCGFFVMQIVKYVCGGAGFVVAQTRPGRR
ncbi:MAG: glycosyltransferase [Candidatus Eremiobacteraeota bacterium]|nr:glycosyltransferase [Candidatus Eremiobacteraeota bacterium]